jgi:hypothetical protein
MSEPKSPAPITALETLRLRASQAMGALGSLKASPWNALNFENQRGHLEWAAAQGEPQAQRGLTDPVSQALFFNRMQERFESLPGRGPRPHPLGHGLFWASGVWRGRRAFGGH